MEQLEVNKEFTKTKLSDRRLTKRSQQIARGVISQPNKSTPQQFPKLSDLEGTYRFFNNPNVMMHEILSGHYEQTGKRSRSYNTVLVLHDTTSFSFSGERHGLGSLRGKGSKLGYYCHASLCVGLSEHRDPLGLLATHVWTRTEQTKKMREAAGHTEMTRWIKGVHKASKHLSQDIERIHIMDREGDSYGLFSELIKDEERFIIRGTTNRVTTEPENLFDIVDAAPIQATRMVELSSRKQSPLPVARRVYPTRRQRKAKLEIRAKSVTLKRSGNLHGRRDIPKTIKVNVVCVSEINCPQGEPPVEWYLLTSEPIDTVNEILFIVDAYRARWLIEEFFKAIKTGCEYQKLQYETYDALLRALGIYLPVAWVLLRLRYLSGINEETPAAMVFNNIQLAILRTFSESLLPKELSLRQAFLLVAKKGGHIKNNGEPGWLVLGRGMHDLLLMEQGFRAVMKLEKCDQS